MAKTNAERQRDWRQRRTRHISEIEAEMDASGTALRAERDDLRAENEGLRGALAAAEAELERLAGMACKHPSGAVVNGSCRACGADDLWLR